MHVYFSVWIWPRIFGYQSELSSLTKYSGSAVTPMNRSIFSKYRSGALAIALALAAFPVSQQAHAHPHEFVTMDMTARFDSNKHMSGMTYVWTFDEFFLSLRH